MDGCPISTEPKKCAAGMNRGLTRGAGDEGCSALVESTARGVSWAERGGYAVYGALCVDSWWMGWRVKIARVVEGVVATAE